MEKRTKIILGVIGAALGVYVIYKIMKPPTNSVTSDADLKQMEEEIKNGNTNKPNPTPANKGKTNADVLFPSAGNFSWKEYFFGIKPIWSRSLW
jgi:hypothetical protein